VIFLTVTGEEKGLLGSRYFSVNRRCRNRISSPT